jgi:hypothetical protein
VPASGNVLVTMTALIDPAASSSGFMSVSTNGSCTGTFPAGQLGPADARSLLREHGTSSDTGATQSSATYLLTGLSAGSHAFRACYKAGATAGATFANRNLIVMPLP